MVCDDLSDWGSIAQVQWRHFNRPKDAYSLRVVRTWELEVPRTVRDAFVPGTSEHGPFRNSLRRLIFRPVLYPNDHPRDWSLKDGGGITLRVGDVAAKGHSHRLCLSLAGPLADLTFAGICTQALALARCHAPSAVNQLFPDFPPSHFIQNLCTDCVVVESGFQLSASGFDHVSSLLRSWAPRILFVRDQGGGDNHVEHDLRAALRFLGQASDALSINARPGELCAGRLYTSMELFSWLRLSSLLRDRSRLDIILRRAMACVFSGSLLQQLDTFLAANQNVIPDKATLSRARLTLDISIMVNRRAIVDGPAMFRVGWIDSSPILGYDLLMSRCLEILLTDLVECFGHVNLLIRDQVPAPLPSPDEHVQLSVASCVS